MAATVRNIAAQCDGLRCDMSMLLLNDIFSGTWKEKAGMKPEKEFWEMIIPEARKINPEFLFIAEAYWNKEWEMMQLGFDLCYDKPLYDKLITGDAREVMNHLTADQDFQKRLLRFIENHDEKRAATFLPVERHIALAIASLTLPGGRLLHHGQLEGKSIRVPVFLNRPPDDPENHKIIRFYEKLLNLLKSDAARKGKWNICEVSGWPDNQTCLNLLAWEWSIDPELLLIIVNLSDQPAQARIKSTFSFHPERTYQLFDVISGELFSRDGYEMNAPGLFIGLPPWGVHTLSVEL
jgi:hypothetical protein